MEPELKKWKEEVHKNLMTALDNVGIMVGDKINMLVSTEIPKKFDESIIRKIYADKGLKDINISIKGCFFKKKTISGRSDNFILEEDVMRQWSDWSEGIISKYGVFPSNGVCRA